MMTTVLPLPQTGAATRTGLYKRYLRIPKPALAGLTLAPTAALMIAGGFSYGTLALTLLLTLTALATALDLAFRRIPNWLTGGILLQWLAGLAYFGLATHGWQALLGFTVGFGMMLIFYLTLGGGEGDVKMLGVIGAITGPWLMIDIIALSYIFSGLFCLVLFVVVRGVNFRKLPMAPFITLGVWAALRGVVS